MIEQNEIGKGIRDCGPADVDDMLAIINAAAEAYRAFIPDERWHDPYMSADELATEIADGVTFSGYEADRRLVGVMGVQRRHNVDLVRHAYVLPRWQGHRVGARLLGHLCHDAARPILVGTWAAADWAIHFYKRHGFTRVGRNDIVPLLRTYWNVPDRQIATSVVLASPPLAGDGARQLISVARGSVSCS